jgi:hypothetical protein
VEGNTESDMTLTKEILISNNNNNLIGNNNEEEENVEDLESFYYFL